MSRKYKIRNQEKLYFISFSVVYWIDVFIRVEYKDILIDSLKYCQKYKGLELYAYVVMSSHVHLIVGSGGISKLEDIIRDLKKYTAKAIISAIKNNERESRREWLLWMFRQAGNKNSNNKTYQFWRQDNHPIELSENYLMEQKLDYIHNNPVEAGIVEEDHHYLYSSAKQYAGEDGLLDIFFIE